MRLFEYYRCFVEEYVNIIESLQHLKVNEFWHSSKKSNVRHKWTNQKFQNQFNTMIFKVKTIWEDIKCKICNAFILKFPDFSKLFILYTDDSKECEFDIVIHQMNEMNIEHSVLFLFKTLQKAERNYSFIKLKMTALVWALRKTSQYFDSSNFTIVTDHHALWIALQTTFVNKRQNHWLNNWVLFLTQYLFHMKIIHWAEKLHRNTDMLSRLLCENENKKNVNAYLITMLQLSEKFTTCIVNMLLNDPHFCAIYNKIQRQITLTVNNSDSSWYSYHCFFWDSQWHILIFDKNWLCILKAL